jgi:limonene-1,2-epoxide hydrolase
VNGLALPTCGSAILRVEMSQENVRKTEEYMAAYNRRDFDAAVKDFHPQVDWVLPERQSFDSCQGPRQIIRFWEGLDDTFDELRLLPQETVDGGDRVAVRLRHAVRGKGSGVEMEEELYHQITFFEDGLMVRIEYVATWEEALEAVRLGSGAELERAPEDELA